MRNHKQQSLFTVLSLDVALKGIESGYRQCFRSIPSSLSQHHTLCDTYELLCVDVLGGQFINEIFNDLKSRQSNYEREYKCYREIKGNKLEVNLPVQYPQNAQSRFRHFHVLERWLPYKPSLSRLGFEWNVRTLVVCPFLFTIQGCKVKLVDGVTIEGSIVSVNHRVMTVDSQSFVIVRDRES